MKLSCTTEYLRRTSLIDHDHSDITSAVSRITAGADNDVMSAVRLHDFVRDEILFGWAPQFDSQSASQVLRCGIGFCNTKTTLLTALLRAAGIPARIHCVSINRRILSGLIRPPSQYVDHSYVEVALHHRWIGIDSYIVDRPLHRAAVAECNARHLLVGFGVHVRGSTHWDGQSNSFSQFLVDDSVPDMSDRDFGSFNDIDAFRATGLGRNPRYWPARLGIRVLTHVANHRETALRAQSPSRLR